MFNFLRWTNKFATRTTKHAASKKGHTHQHNLSKGQLNHLKFVALEKINKSPNVNEYMNHPVLLQDQFYPRGINF